MVEGRQIKTPQTKAQTYPVKKRTIVDERDFVSTWLLTYLPGSPITFAMM
jgi:hypothetical protein